MRQSYGGTPDISAAGSMAVQLLACVAEVVHRLRFRSRAGQASSRARDGVLRGLEVVGSSPPSAAALAPRAALRFGRARTAKILRMASIRPRSTSFLARADSDHPQRLAVVAGQRVAGVAFGALDQYVGVIGEAVLRRSEGAGLRPGTWRQGALALVRQVVQDAAVDVQGQQPLACPGRSAIVAGNERELEPQTAPPARAPVVEDRVALSARNRPGTACCITSSVLPALRVRKPSRPATTLSITSAWAASPPRGARDPSPASTPRACRWCVQWKGRIRIQPRLGERSLVGSISASTPPAM